MENFIYRGYTIEHHCKPVFSHCMDWEWTSDDFDLDCNHYYRCGFSPSEGAAMAAVDFDILQNKQRQGLT